MADNIAQPGQTVAPSQPGSTEPPAPPAAPEPPTAPTPPAPEPPAPEPTPPEQAPQPPEEQSFNPSPETESETSDTAQSISWTASEFIDHTKSFGWYAVLILAAAAFAGLIFLLTRDFVSTGVIIVAALVFGIYAGHKPRELEYRLDARGLNIGQKHFTYDQFRSFSVLPEGAFSSIVFMPLRRFAAPTTIYYAPEDENKIVSLLGSYLPLEERDHDAVDRLMHRIHF